MSQPPDMTANSEEVLPTHWPSAWSSLRGRIAVSAVFPVVTCAVAVVIMVFTGVLVEVWWIAALPLLLLIGPLTLPARTRAAMQSAYEKHELQVTTAQVGLVVRTPRKRRGVRPDATVVPGRDGGYAVTYYLN
ncbi:hypothetical protein CLV47_107110 [Antricoccus suffuscus]|uniref:Uncharacterized protein n=1 Tax=Antricoccus suffuscus TaxID=1629062 RepID=A0A2T1A060_9ACTN|nr:hypothetical protein [Antricoccus suffuscus]PRZ41982.1 hypothetical protein CLV47_107110 [Antricoccus suffuscus]